uniref:Uncharacterized protein n=1 Tax=Cyclophora tenuis TaxID=216820 RepID=A0A7S1DBH8_CYCTE|mmetsp:Transcript_546/g.949  ORF Transcript_546/g.949 Transcript_546/m.949 type:complete len:173 (+) Transcript_546:121-639(+)
MSGEVTHKKRGKAALATTTTTKKVGRHKSAAGTTRPKKQQEGGASPPRHRRAVNKPSNKNVDNTDAQTNNNASPKRTTVRKQTRKPKNQGTTPRRVSPRRQKQKNDTATMPTTTGAAGEKSNPAPVHEELRQMGLSPNDSTAAETREPGLNTGITTEVRREMETPNQHGTVA